MERLLVVFLVAMLAAALCVACGDDDDDDDDASDTSYCTAAAACWETSGDECEAKIIETDNACPGTDYRGCLSQCAQLHADDAVTIGGPACDILGDCVGDCVDDAYGCMD